MLPGHLALIGYRGTGKSTVARLLGDALQRSWYDADVELTRVAGKSIRDIFATQGEEAFRNLESAVLQDLLARPAAVIATGGGVVTRKINCERLAASATIVWLRASAPTILARLEQDATTAAMRPALSTADQRTEVVEMLAQRTPMYQALATIVVDTDGKSPASIVSEILSALAASTASTKPAPRGEPV